MTVAKRRRSSSTDDKVEAKRKIIRRSLDEITAEVVSELQKANLRAGINIVVPSRHSIVAIGCPVQPSPDEWSQMSGIVCRVLGQKLGGVGLRGRPLARAMATAKLSVAEVTPD